jgi:hypothetical protein
MIALLSVACLAAGSGFGWYGHKASLRIQAWGEKLNELDQNIRFVTGTGEYSQSQRGSMTDNGQGSSGRGSSLTGHGLPLSATSFK